MVALTDEPEPRPTAAPEALAGACVLLWALGALASHRIGIWAGVGGSALALGGAVLLWGRPVVGPLLAPALAPVAIGLLAGAVMVAGTYLLYPVVGAYVVSVPEQTASLYVTFGGATGLARLLLLPPIILAEELVWRGIVQTALLRRLRPIPAVVLTAAAYALAHAPAGSWLLTCLALMCGLYWGALRAASGSLLPPLLAHVLWDVAILILWPLAPPR